MTERRLGIPVALAIALLFHAFSAGRFLQRTFFSMWLHELGHAVAAWLCGRPAFPGPWFTPVGAEKSAVLVGLIAGGLAFAGWKFRATWLRWPIGALLGVQLICALLLRDRAAEQLILYAGDAGALVFGAVGMASWFFVRGSLRWGFLVIGAASFVDVFTQWWAASADLDLIPYGENEGSGLSDPSRLNELYGWTSRQIVERYVWLGIVCLGVLTALNLWVARTPSSPRSPPPDR